MSCSRLISSSQIQNAGLLSMRAALDKAEKNIVILIAVADTDFTTLISKTALNEVLKEASGSGYEYARVQFTYYNKTLTIHKIV